MQILTEKEIAIKALKLIAERPGIATNELIEELEQIFSLHPDDKKILKNRNDSHFSQKVRNLVSHLKTNFFGKHVIKGIKKKNSYTWTLNEKGKVFVEKQADENIKDLIIDQEFDEEVANANILDNLGLEKAENREPSFSNTNLGKRYKKDPRITKTYLEKINNKCEYDQNHITFIAAKTKANYVEGHHLIPMKFQKQFSFNIDRKENLVALCPNCHRLIHLGEKSEKQRILKKLYINKINQLNAINIEISLEDLYNKYYS